MERGKRKVRKRRGKKEGKDIGEGKLGNKRIWGRS